VDYIEDLELIKKIFDKLLKPSKYISYQSVFDLLENNPEILKINKKWS
jgi:spore coat polysaccharide biosynthesis protein SpsF (cytidylyltransferase family)